jgi:hypothetical protein
MPAAAQGGVTIKATVDKNRIMIGEHFTLRLEADIPETEAIRFFNFDTLPHFEFLDRQKIDTSNTSTGTLLVQQIRMTSFDSGQWVIPRFALDENLATDSIPIDVVFSSPFDPNQEYHDIKDVIDVEVEEKEEWWWYAAGGALLLLVLIIWLLLRKKPVPVKEAEPPVHPYEEAMKELENLEKNKPAAKAYYSELVDIFRVYVARKKGISSLQKTTDDLVVQLRGLDIQKDNFDRLAQSLRLSDYVKFAKYEPSPEDDSIAMRSIRQSITEIEKVN